MSWKYTKIIRPFSKEAIVGLLILSASHVYAAPPPDTELVRKADKVRSSQRSTPDGKEISTVTYFDTQMPWPFNKGKLIFSAESPPQVQSQAMMFNAIIFPVSEFGPLQYLNQYNGLNRTPSVGTVILTIPERPDLFSKNSYGDRYIALEKAIKRAVLSAIESRGPSINIALASPSHPVYFSNADAVAFYTISGINEAFKEAGKKYNLMETRVTIFVNHDEHMKKKYEKEQHKRVFFQNKVNANPSLKNSPENFRVFFTFDTEIERSAEIKYFLDHIEKVASAERTNIGDVVREILSADYADQEIKRVPKNVFNFIHQTMYSIYSTGEPDLKIIRGHIQKIVESEKIPEFEAKIKVDELMKQIQSNKIAQSSKMAIFEIMGSERLSPIEKAVNRVVKK